MRLFKPVKNFLYGALCIIADIIWYGSPHTIAFTRIAGAAHRLQIIWAIPASVILRPYVIPRGFVEAHLLATSSTGVPAVIATTIVFEIISVSHMNLLQ